MKIAILTANETLYLPAFFDNLLSNCDDVRAVFCTSPAHGKKGTRGSLAKKYIAAFGVVNFMWLALRMASAKIYGLFDFLPTGGAHSIASAARRHGVLCENVADVNDALFIQKLKALGVDLIISVSCPQIFEKDLITLSKMGCLNIHGAPLPKYRGLLPSFWMMTKGEELAAVTIFLVNEKIDAGDVVLVEHFPIYPDESLHRFLVRSKRIHCEALLRAITLIDSGASIKTYPLEINAGSYFGFPKREDYLEFVSKGRSLW